MRSGLLAGRREGQWVYYRIDPALPGWAQQVLQLSADDNGGWIAPHLKALNTMKNRPVSTANCC